MARRGASIAGRDYKPTPTLELFRGMKHSNIEVGTSVEQIPNTNLSFRKGLIIQNKHASAVVYVGGGIPYYIEGTSKEVYTDADHDKRALQWFKSTTVGSTNEWWLGTSAKANPGLTQVTYLYYATTFNGSETLATGGTVGTLGAQHTWGWGTSADVTGNTLFIRTGGNNPGIDYALMLGYYFVLTADDTAATGGIELTAGNSLSLTADGSVRIFAIASGATTPVGILEVV